MLKDNLKAARLQAGMTLDEVAQKVGVSRQTIQRYESGVIQNIPSDNIEKIASILDVSPGVLMGWESPDHTAGDIRSNAPPPPLRGDARSRKQLEKILADDQLTYNGVVFGDDDREKLKRAVELAFWDIKEMNKKKK